MDSKMPRLKDPAKPPKTLSKGVRLPLEICIKIEEEVKKNKSDFSSILKQRLYKSYVEDDDKLDNIINKTIKNELSIFRENMASKFDIFEDKISSDIEGIKDSILSIKSDQKDFSNTMHYDKEKIVSNLEKISEALNSYRKIIKELVNNNE